MEELTYQKLRTLLRKMLKKSDYYQADLLLDLYSSGVIDKQIICDAFNNITIEYRNSGLLVPTFEIDNDSHCRIVFL
jgi:hypothetical protein